MIPNHVWIILDGNRRWAKARWLQPFEGHIAGAETLEKMTEYIFDKWVKILTVFGFSTENWKRSQLEVNALMKIFLDYLGKMIKKLEDKQIKVNILWEKSAFNSNLRKTIYELEASTREKDGYVFNLLLNYGGRADIIQAVQHIVWDVQNWDLMLEDIDEKLISNYLYTEWQPDPDLIIRTSGENRLSGFLTWQSAYAELLFIDAMRPDFDEKIFDECLEEFARRNRRFWS